MQNSISWLELDAQSLHHNIQTFRSLLGQTQKLAAVVKANAYGHGILEVAEQARIAGVDWFAVHTLEEGLLLRQAGHICPILCMGYAPFSAIPALIDAEISLVVYNEETLQALSAASHAKQKQARVHFKLETGTNRQGISFEKLERFLSIWASLPGLKLEGLSTHFANIEDTTDHRYAFGQLERFERMVAYVEERVGKIPYIHCASTAATLLFPQTHFNLVRVGIGLYGLWPSRETKVSILQKGLSAPKLAPVLTWKTILAQVKEVPAGQYISYGCTYKTMRNTLVGVLPIGYSNGYARELSNRAHVLVRGQRARILGRICMNLCMVELTDIGPVQLEEEVVLLGKQGEEQITAEQLADWMGTINYEVVARLSREMPRMVV